MDQFFERPVLEIDDIEQPACEYGRSRGWVMEKVVSLSRNGWPDRFCARKPRIMLLEFKKPGEVPNGQQRKRHRELRAAGVEVHWVATLEEAKELLR